MMIQVNVYLGVIKKKEYLHCESTYTRITTTTVLLILLLLFSRILDIPFIYTFPSFSPNRKVKGNPGKKK